MRAVIDESSKPMRISTPPRLPALAGLRPARRATSDSIGVLCAICGSALSV